MPHGHIIFPLFSCYIYIYDYIYIFFSPLFAAHFSCFFFSVLCFQRQSPGFAGCCPCSSGACDATRTSRTSHTGTTPTVGQLADLATGGSWWIHVALPDLHTRSVTTSVTRVTTSESFTECYHMLPYATMFHHVSGSEMCFRLRYHFASTLQSLNLGKALQVPNFGVGAWAWGDRLFWGYNEKQDQELREGAAHAAHGNCAVPHVHPGHPLSDHF